MAINFGAPGDRRDEFGTLWLGYPRPSAVGRMEYVFDLKPVIDKRGKYYCQNRSSVEVEGAETPWIFTSGARGMTRFAVPLRAKEDGAAAYTVKLYFAELEQAQAGQTVFDIKLQGETAAESVDVIAEAGGTRRALVHAFSGIAVDGELEVELVPKAGMPIVSAIQVSQE
jgi:hypothetical protein